MAMLPAVVGDIPLKSCAKRLGRKSSRRGLTTTRRLRESVRYFAESFKMGGRKSNAVRTGCGVVISSTYGHVHLRICGEICLNMTGMSRG